jgi:hypothetical protein
MNIENLMQNKQEKKLQEEEEKLAVLIQIIEARQPPQHN